MKEVKITKSNEGQRVDKYVKKYLNEAPLSMIYKLFRKKDIKVNDHWVKNDYILKENDILKIYIKDEQYNDFNKPISIVYMKHNLDIVYEDENILVVNKPAEILVHEDSKEKVNTLANEVLAYLYDKGEYKNGDVFKPSPAHRLDRNTSGIMFFGKNNEVLQALETLFKEKENITKEYVALCYGIINESGTINKALLKDATKNEVYISDNPYAKTAITKYEPIKRYKDYTLTKIQILTGRTHQIRVHMAYIGHPVIGDAKYGNFEENRKFEKLFGLKYQFLHSESLTFGKIDGILAYLSNKKFEAPLPKKLQDILSHLV